MKDLITEITESLASNGTDFVRILWVDENGHVDAEMTIDKTALLIDVAATLARNDYLTPHIFSYN